MLQLQNVTKTYKTKAGTVDALNGISLTFPETGLVFITGKSGCGKTTLLNVIGGLDGIDGGEILIQDKKFSEFSAAEYDSYRNTFIGFIFQEYNLLPEYTVEKNIKMAMELQGRKVDDQDFQKLLEDVEIKDLKNRKPSELSGGQRQRVAIARALVKQPRIIMADEPTGALDSGTGVQVLDTLKKLSKNTLIIIVSHDQEFAEKYADRIIHLEDGHVVQDVTFNDKEVAANVCQQGDNFIVREGADLSEDEKNALAKAIKERKNIEIIEKPSFRDKKLTGEVKLCVDEPVSLRKSKMKLKSEAFLGLKSLTVKPIRLIITILIAALAFGVFGVFDTIANFSTSKILKNQLNIAPSNTVVATADYLIPGETEDGCVVKVSQDFVDELQSRTKGKVKGIFDLRDNRAGAALRPLDISEAKSTTVSVGQQYYTKTANGFIEFDVNTEISENGDFKDFDYKLIEGRYPTPVYENGEFHRESLYEVAISSYVADSIIHYLRGRELNGKAIKEPKDLLDAYITVNAEQYKVVGIIDCGGVPAKYDVLKTLTLSNDYTALIDDFKAYIDSGAHKCVFVAQGFLQAMRAEDAAADIYYGGDVEWRLASLGGVSTSASKYFYNVEGYGQENVLLFNCEYPENGKITLADDEVLIHPNNLKKLFNAQLSNLKPTSLATEVRHKIDSLQTGTMEDNRNTLNEIFDDLDVNLSTDSFDFVLSRRPLSESSSEKTNVKIVGVYFGLDLEDTPLPTTYRLMVNSNLLRKVKVFTQQGEYDKVLFSPRSVREGKDTIVNYMLSESLLGLTWYNNSALTVIRTNETMIHQVSELFLYATIALSLFAIFMLYSYMSTSIASKKQSVGILRALGAGGKNILRMFLIECLIVTVINGLLANVLAWVGCMLVNVYTVNVMNISVHFALFGAHQVLIISAVCLLTALASSLLPIIKISKKKPVELIRRS